jgi:hypothetical protein
MRPRDYLPADTPALNVAIVERAHDDIGSGEDIGPDGIGTNRSDYCDRVNARFGSPPGSYWCANAVGGWWMSAGACIPPVPGAADSWRVWGKQTGRWRTTPHPGYAVLYGARRYAEHVAVIARLVPDPTEPGGHRVLEIGGNSSLGRYDRDGWTVAEKAEDADRVLGYVSPDPLDGRA